MKKYELTNETVQIRGRTLHRIKALIDFSDVKAGYLGGFIEKEENLTHSGDAWVYDNAIVCDDAQVFDNAIVCDNAKISDDAWVYGHARVYNDAWVYDNASVFGNAQVYDNVWVGENVLVGNDAQVYGYAQILGNSLVVGDAQVCDSARISGDAQIYNSDDYSTIQGFGKGYRNITFFKQNDGSIGVNCQRYDCFDETGEYFFDTIDKFREYTSLIMNKKMAKEYLVIADLMENHFRNLSIEEVQEWDD